MKKKLVQKANKRNRRNEDNRHVSRRVLIQTNQWKKNPSQSQDGTKWWMHEIAVFSFYFLDFFSSNEKKIAYDMTFSLFDFSWLCGKEKIEMPECRMNEKE